MRTMRIMGNSYGASFITRLDTETPIILQRTV